MAFHSLLQAFKAYVAVPAVWSSGIVSCIGILLAYLAYTLGGGVPAILVILLTILLVPFFFSGTYGVILDNNKKRGAFIIYGAYGYFKTLLPWLFLLLVTFVIGEALAYFLLVAGLSPSWVMVICCLIIFPIIFYCYFADVCAIRHNLRTWQAVKHSAKSVTNASFSVVAFYMVHILLILFIIPLIMDLIFSLFGGTEIIINGLMDILNNLGINDIANIDPNALFEKMSDMSQNEFEALIVQAYSVFTSEGVIRAIAFSSAIIALLFVPLLVAYKAYYFQKLIEANQRAEKVANSEHTVEEEEEGEYDEKGRWFKYK